MMEIIVTYFLLAVGEIMVVGYGIAAFVSVNPNDLTQTTACAIIAFCGFILATCSAFRLDKIKKEIANGNG